MRKTLPKFYNKEKDLIQCQECKKWFKMLGAHLAKIHWLSGDEYKDKYGLIDGDLIALSARYNMSVGGKKAIKNNPERLKMMLKNSKKYLIKAWKTPKNIKFRVKEIHTQNKITPELRKKLNKGIRKYSKTARAKRNYKIVHEKMKRGKIIKCKCGEKFYIRQSRVRLNSHHYCSRKCKALYEPKTKMWREKHKTGLDKKYKDKRIKTKCKKCGKIFINIISKKYKFCSWKCYKQWYKINALTRQPNYYKNYYKKR